MSKNATKVMQKSIWLQHLWGTAPQTPCWCVLKQCPPIHFHLPTPMETYLVPLNTKRQGTVELSLYSTLSTISNCLLSNTFRCDNISLARVPQGIGI